jgi:hypothetical protein
MTTSTLNPETYTDETGTYRAVPDDQDSCQPGCDQCVLNSTPSCDNAPCISTVRSDNTFVHFVRIK